MKEVWLILPGSTWSHDIDEWEPASVFARWEDAVALIKVIDDEEPDDVAEFKVETTPDEVTVTRRTGEVFRILAVPIEGDLT